MPIKTIPNLSHDARALKLWVAAKIEFLENNYHDSEIDDYTFCSMPAIISYSGNVYNGLLAYYKQDNGAFWIQTSYVRPSNRGTGIYKTLRDKLSEIAIEENVHSICSGVYTTNKSSIRANLKYGSKISYYHFVQKVNPQ
jgi:predicted GNAT family acetyltransferase